MKTTRKITACLLVLFMMVISVSAGAASYKQRFWDVPKEHWAFEYIADLTVRGVITGYDNGSFKPEATVTRAEWAKMMCVAGNLDVYDTAVYFRDTEGHWANSYINAAKTFINSFNDLSFRPDQAITREDVTRSLVVLRGYDISDVDYSHISAFADSDSISTYMKPYVAVAVEIGLVTGFEDNTFRGQGTLSRAEAAALLYRAFQKGDASKTTATPDVPYENPNVGSSTDNSSTSDAIEDTDSSNLKEDYASSEPGIPNTDTVEDDSSTGLNTEIANDEVNGDSYIDTNRGTSSSASIDLPLSISADAEHPDNISTDGKNTVYYVSGRRVISHDVKTNKATCIADLDAIEVDTDSAYKSNFQLYSICYDEYTGGVLLFGHYKVVNSSTDKSTTYIYSATRDGIKMLCDEVPSDLNYLVTTLENGDIVGETAVYGRSDLEYKYNYAGYILKDNVKTMWGKSFNVAEYSDKLNFIGIYEWDVDTAWGERVFKVAEYDYERTEPLWDINSGSWGIGNNKVVAWDGDSFNIYNTHGKLLHSVSVKGKTPTVLSRVLVMTDCFAYYNMNDKTLNVMAFED